MKQQNQEQELERNEMLDEIKRLIAGGANVRDACAAAGVPRSQYYKWRKRRLDNPTGGLRDLSRRPPTHGANVSEVQRERICALAVEFPRESCDKLKGRLVAEGIERSSTTIQNVLNSAGLCTRKERLARAKQLALGCRGQLQKLPSRRSRTKGDRAYEKFRFERTPGQFVVQSFYRVSAPKRLGKLYLHFIFDAATEWLWFDLSWGSGVEGMPQARDAIALLESGALEAFAKEDIKICYIFSDDRAIFSGEDSIPHRDSIAGNLAPYPAALRSRDIAHRAFEAAWWKSKSYLSNLLRRLKASFPTQDTLARCLEQRASNLTAKSD